MHEAREHLDNWDYEELRTGWTVERLIDRPEFATAIWGTACGVN